MRALPLMLFACVFVACESKEAAPPAEEEFPPVPTMSAAPGSKPVPAVVPAELPPPQVEVREAEPEESVSEDEEAPQPADKKSAQRSSGAVGGPSGGSGSGSGAGSGGSVGELLEARSTTSWKVSVTNADGDLAAAKRVVRRGERNLLRCASFLAEGTTSMSASVSIAKGVVLSVSTSPQNDTVQNCIVAQSAQLRFDAATTSVAFKFQR